MKKFFAVIGAAVLFFFSLSIVKKITAGIKKARASRKVKATCTV